MPAPIDVKLMNVAASLLFCAFAVILVAAGTWWLLRHPLFALGGIGSGGCHAQQAWPRCAPTWRRASPATSSRWSLDNARQAFEAVPWVRRAVVRREFPNRLKVLLQEHQAVAYWGAEGESKLLNTFGEVFEANIGDVEQDGLPRLGGPDGEAAQVLAMYRVLQPMFEPLDLSVEDLVLTGRGSWQAVLDTGAVIELGRGTQASWRRAPSGLCRR
jgi:cell division protein FtsQ